MAELVLKALERLLDSNCNRILPYLYGALFSLVSHVRIANVARKMRLDQKIQDLHREADG